MRPAWKGKRLWWAPLLVFDALTGLRLREVMGLRWPDVDFRNRRLNVECQVVTHNGAVEFIRPKTKAAVRTLGIPELGIDLLQEHREMIEKYRRRKGDPRKWTDYGLIFPSQTGYPASPTRVNTNLRKILELANLPPMSVKALRHGFATTLFSQGVPNRTASKVLGHADEGTFYRVYAHLTDEVASDAADAVTNALTQAGAPRRLGESRTLGAKRDDV